MTLLFDMYNICRKKMLCDKLCNKQFFRSVQVCFRLEYFLSAGFWKFWLQKRPFSPNYDILTMSCVYPVHRICKIDNLSKCIHKSFPPLYSIHLFAQKCLVLQFIHFLTFHAMWNGNFQLSVACLWQLPTKSSCTQQ